MNIRPKMIPMFQNGNNLPSTVTWTNPNSTWFTRSGNNILEGTYNYIKPFYDKWKSSGKQEDYQAYKKAVDALNSDQRYGYAPGHLRYQSGNNQLFKDDSVGAWQNIVRRNYNYINNSLGKNINKYHVESSNPYSGDNPSQGWKIDKLWAGETDDRTTWGNLQNENDSEYQKWKQKFSEIGIDYRTNPEWNTGNVLYGFLKDPQDSPNNPPSQTPQKQTGTSFNPAEKLDPKNDFWQRLSAGFNKIAPDLLAAVRYAGNMHNNERVYNEMKQAIIPNLQGTYTTHRQIVGDEATKQAYYRRAAQGESKAAKAFTSDADRQMAYMMEAKRIGDELRAQGDLADNQEIRRTSDESNQHQWANAQRANEVANANITELNKAKAARHQLTAQKYTADWTNTDQYLLGWESKFKQKQAEEKELERQLALLDTKEDLLNDTTLRDLRTAADDAYNAYSNETDATKKAALKQKYEKAIKDYQLYNIQKTRLNLRRQYEGVYTAKTGTKITKKNNSDKFLYKTSRDIVEHFRKMSKMTDDSRIRTMPKPAKLSSHPRKMQLGGVAPFTIYRPLGAGMETTAQTSTSTDSKSSKDTAAKDKLDMIKELFKQVQGLPVDVSQVYQHMVGVFNKARAFGEEMSSDDIAAMYLSSMNEIAKLKYSQKAYEDARNVAVANDAMNEIAVGANGEIALYDSENQKVKRGSLKQLQDSDGKLMALTNGQLLTMRAHSPNLAFDDQVFDIVNNGVGMSKIATHIKSIAGTIGSMETKIEGISEVQSKRIKSGLQILAGTEGTPDGFYKVTNDKKDSSANVKAALNYIYNILPKNYRTILELNSNGNGQELIYNMLVSQVNDFEKQDIAPLTGKASEKDKEDSLDKLGINSATQLLLGMSSPREFTFNIGNGNAFTGAARVSSITKDGNPVGADFMYSEIYKSDLHKNLDLDNASFGDVPINKSLKDRIVIDNSTIAGVDLPYTTDRNGRIIPDFQMLNRIEEADQEVLRAGIDPNKDPQKVNEIYAKHKLPIKYGANNKLTGSYKRFAVIQATAIEDVFLNKDGLASNGTLTLVSDENEINKYLGELKKVTGEKEIDMDRPGLFTGNKDIYKGSIFIPIIGDLVDAVSATRGLKAGNYDELRSKYQTKNYNEAPQFVKQ